MHSIIVADGEIRPGPAVSRALARAETEETLVVAADGGALKAQALGLTPAVVVGDGDSLPAARIDDLRRARVEVIIHPTDKDASDTELALHEAIRRGATDITICGAFGGTRLEHAIANLLLLALPELASLDVSLVDGPSTVRAIGHGGPGSLAITGSPGDFVSLLPLSESVRGVTTSGLRFALSDATLLQGPSRGLSNELSDHHADVRTTDGRLAVIHTEREVNR